jgi:hypothetical protein
MPELLYCHASGGNGITANLDNGGTIQNAQAIAARETAITLGPGLLDAESGVIVI